MYSIQYFQIFSFLLRNSKLTSYACQITKLCQSTGATCWPFSSSCISISSLLWGEVHPGCIFVTLILPSNFKLNFSQSLSHMYTHILLNFLCFSISVFIQSFRKISSSVLSFPSFILLSPLVSHFLLPLFSCSLKFFLFLHYCNILCVKNI